MRTKILHVLNHSIPNSDGYAVRSASIVRFQREMGLEPIVLTTSYHEPPRPECVEEIDGTRYYRTAPGRRIAIPGMREFAAIRRVRKRITQVIEMETPDVVHAHSPCLWGEAAWRAARRHNLPVVYEMRSLWEDGAVDQQRTRPGSLRYRLSRALEMRVIRRVDAVVTIAQHLRGDLITRGAESSRLFLVPNGVDPTRFDVGEKNMSLANSLGLENCTVFGYVGSLYRWEGVDNLVRAFALLKTAGDQLQCLIIGSGEEENNLRSLVRELGLSDKVKFVGKIFHGEIAQYYSLVDILVYPRKRTRLTELVTPLKPLEAMAMGKPIIGSDIGGIRELLPNGTGLLFRPDDPQDLADKCLYLANNRTLRNQLGNRARDYIVAGRDWRMIVKAYEEVYAYAQENSVRQAFDRPREQPRVCEANL